MKSIVDTLTEVYVFVADFLASRPDLSQWRRSNNAEPAFTDAEVLTIGLMQSLLQSGHSEADLSAHGQQLNLCLLACNCRVSPSTFRRLLHQCPARRRFADHKAIHFGSKRRNQLTLTSMLYHSKMEGVTALQVLSQCFMSSPENIMTSPEEKTKMITTTDYEGSSAFIMIRQLDSKINIIVSQEQNGDAEIALTAHECEKFIGMLRQEIALIESNQTREMPNENKFSL